MKSYILLITLFLYALNSFASGATVEHQIRLCESESSLFQKMQAIKDIAITHKQFEVFYLDNPSRQFQQNKWSIRFRDKGNKFEVTVKKRLGSNETPQDLENLECEYDLHGTSREYTCKIDEDFDSDKFQKILSHKIEWNEVLSKSQISLLNKFGGTYPGALIFGSLLNNRYQWNDATFGKVTLDLIHLKTNEKYMFHEISLRYNEADALKVGPLFEKYIQSIGFSKCSNQIDWPVNKFDIFDVLN